MLSVMKSRPQQVEDVHALLRELGEEDGSDRAEEILEAIKAFDLPSVIYAANRFDLDGVRRAVAAFDQIAESQGDLGGYAIYDLAPLHKALAGFDEIADLIGDPELTFQAVLAYQNIVNKISDLWEEQILYRGTATSAREKREPYVEDPHEWEDLIAVVLSQRSASGDEGAGAA